MEERTIRIYAVYDGDTFADEGNVYELSSRWGVSPGWIYDCAKQCRHLLPGKRYRVYYVRNTLKCVAWRVLMYCHKAVAKNRLYRDVKGRKPRAYYDAAIDAYSLIERAIAMQRDLDEIVALLDAYGPCLGPEARKAYADVSRSLETHLARYRKEQDEWIAAEEAAERENDEQVR